MRMLLWSAITILGCSKANDSKPQAKPSHETQPQGTSELGPTSFAMNLGGAAIKGGAIDEMQLDNAAHVVPGADGERVLLWLKDGLLPDTTMHAHSVRLDFPKRTGTVTAHGLVEIQLDAKHTARYVGDIAINVSSLTATRVAGTFSAADLKLSPDTPDAKPPTNAIQDGSFDVPFATSKITPP